MTKTAAKVRQFHAITWADRYRAAAERLHTLLDGETDGLVREALLDGMTKMTNAMLAHQGRDKLLGED